MATEPLPQSNPISSASAVRPGYLSTEFWLTCALIALAVVSGLKGIIPPEHAFAFATFSASLYKALRIALKAWQGSLDLQAELAANAEPLPAAGPDANGLARDFGTQPEAVRQPLPLAPLVLLAFGFSFLVAGCAAPAPAVPARADATHRGGQVFEADGWSRDPLEPLTGHAPQHPPALRSLLRATPPALREEPRIIIPAGAEWPLIVTHTVEEEAR